MMDVNMNPTPPKVTRKEACLQANGLFRLSKDLGPKSHSNILWTKETKEKKNFMKVEDGGVYHKKYDGCCTKQRIIIPRAT